MNAVVEPCRHSPVRPGTDRDDRLTALYVEHYPRLLAVAGRYLGEGHRCDGEDVVQEAYLRVRARWAQVDPQRGMAYLCQAVANVARSMQRRRVVADRHRATRLVVQASAEDTALSVLLPAAVVAGVRALPGRQREALMLRHYVGLGLADAAAVMGCSTGAVRAYTSRGLSTLTRQMPDAADTDRAA